MERKKKNRKASTSRKLPVVALLPVVLAVVRREEVEDCWGTWASEVWAGRLAIRLVAQRVGLVVLLAVRQGG